jgi:hypothetical protein
VIDRLLSWLGLMRRKDHVLILEAALSVNRDMRQRLDETKYALRSCQADLAASLVNASRLSRDLATEQGKAKTISCCWWHMVKGGAT